MDEFAFGTNTKSPFGSPSEKGRLGTAHFALGDNHNAYPGGRDVSALHLDGADSQRDAADPGHRAVRLDLEGRGVGAGNAPVGVVPLQQAEPIPLPWQRWNRMLVTGGTVGEPRASLGHSVFTLGTVLAMVSREVEEVAFFVAGRGEPRLEDGAVAFGPGHAVFIPPRVWHAVANTGEEDVVMVSGFPHPEYPPTQRR